MSRKLILCYFLFSIILTHAQKELECQTKLSNFHEKAKAKNFDDAYQDWLYVRAHCPSLNLAIYTDGEKILKHKIKTTQSDTQKGFVEDLMLLWNDRKQHFKNETPVGEFGAKSCQLQYDFRKALGKTNDQLYNCFNETFNADKKTFTHPKSLYTYFSLMVTLFNAGKTSATELFNTYDDVNEKIQVEIQNYSEKLNALILQIENGETLSGKEEGKKKAYESYLKNYTLIKNNSDAIADKKANCEILNQLYSKAFNAHENDSVWLKRSVSRMHHKKCTKDELYEKLVKQYDKVAPSADTKFYIATILFKKGKHKEAYQYLEAAFELESRAYEKSKIAFKIGAILKLKNQYSKARKFLLEALRLNPSNGKPHLLIAEMYAKSAKNCGKDNFYQRAVYWLASKEVKKALRVDPTLQKLVKQYVASYEAKAPTKAEIHLRAMSGKTINVKCWINRALLVPKLE